MYWIQQLLEVFLQLVADIYEIFKTAGSFEELEERVNADTIAVQMEGTYIYWMKLWE